jgi:hypothetical protein
MAFFPPRIVHRPGMTLTGPALFFKERRFFKESMSEVAL